MIPEVRIPGGYRGISIEKGHGDETKDSNGNDKDNDDAPLFLW